MNEKELIIKYDKIFNDIELDKLDKKSLIKLINIYQEISDTNIIKFTKENIIKEKNNFKRELMDIRINSLISDITSVKYENKIIDEILSIYYYKSHITIYPNKKIDQLSFSESISKLKYKKIWLIDKKNFKNKIEIKDANDIDFLKYDAWYIKLDI